ERMSMKRARFNPIFLLIAASLLLSLSQGVSAQTGPVNYTVTLDRNPSSHLLHLALSVNSGAAASIDVAMPAWAPGAYMITNPWRNVQEFSAVDEKGAALRFEKIDKQTWRIYTPSGPQAGKLITARYNLYLRDYNDEQCYLRGPNVFMHVLGKRPYP